MNKLLQIDSSIFNEGGQSGHLTKEFVANWRLNNPEGEITRRNFANEPIPHLSEASFQAFITPENERSPEQQAAVAYSDALIAEIQNADTLVLGLPMYNYGVPSQLKAWFDHIARAGITFRYTENGPEGLLKNKTLYVLAARGGLYQGTPKDTQTSYIRDFFNFIGIQDIKFIYAEGLAMGEEPRNTAMSKAQADIQQLAV